MFWKGTKSKGRKCLHDVNMWYAEMGKTVHSSAYHSTRSTIIMPSLAKDIAPISDIFWVCGRTGKVMQVLPKNWSGCCAPVILSGNMVLLDDEELIEGLESGKEGKRKRSVEPFEPIQIIFKLAGSPVGMPVEHQAMNWVGAAFLTGLVLWAQIAKKYTLDELYLVQPTEVYELYSGSIRGLRTATGRDNTW